MNIVLGRSTMRTLLLEEYETNSIPNYYNLNLLPHLTSKQIVYYDEMHVDQEGGPFFRNREQTRFHMMYLEGTTPPPPLSHLN